MAPTRKEEVTMDFIRLDASDNVVTATRGIQAGTSVENIKTVGLIPSGHKISTRDITKGGEIRKYAQQPECSSFSD